MSRIDYYAVCKEIQGLIKADPDTSNATVEIEAQGPLSAEAAPWVNIRLDRRDTPPDQILAAGQIQRYEIRILLYCTGMALDLEEASKQRDDLIGKVESVLMRNRTLSGTVTYIRLQGGAFDVNRAGELFEATGEIVMVADALARL